MPDGIIPQSLVPSSILTQSQGQDIHSTCPPLQDSHGDLRSTVLMIASSDLHAYSPKLSLFTVLLWHTTWRFHDTCIDCGHPVVTVSSFLWNSNGDKEREETLPGRSLSRSDNGQHFLHAEATVCFSPVSDILRVDFVLYSAQLRGRLCWDPSLGSTSIGERLEFASQEHCLEVGLGDELWRGKAEKTGLLLPPALCRRCKTQAATALCPLASELWHQILRREVI